MSQSMQETSRKNVPVQGKKIFEDDIGDDFLSSWKPSAPKKDAALDFGNEAPPKAKRSSFSLDKFDVDFDFDGGFGKLSFDVDMSDLDFKSPPSKTQKSKVKTQEAPQEKKDGFEFDFNFNELDGFDLDSMLPKGREEKKTPVQEQALTPSGEMRGAIPESKSNPIIGKEEKENTVQENASMHSSEKCESVSKSTIKVISQNCDDNSESHYSGEVQQQLPEVQLNFKPSKLSMEEIDSQHGAPKFTAQSPCTSGSQDLDSKQYIEDNPDKQNIMDDSLFRNLLQTADSNTVKQRSILTKSKYFEKAAVPKNDRKTSSQNVDDESESHDGRVVPKQPTVVQSTIKLSEFSMEDVDFQHDKPSKSLAKSLHRDVAFSRSENVANPQNIDNDSEYHDDGTVPNQKKIPFQNSKISKFNTEDVTLQCKQVTIEKQDGAMGTCSENMFIAGASNTLKQICHPSESHYSDKMVSSPSSSSCSGSGHKLSSHTISMSKGIPSKDLKGNQDQSSSQNDGLCKRFAACDVASKNSSPREVEHSKCSSDKSISTNTRTVESNDMKQTTEKLATVVQKDINNIPKRKVNQCQNHEDFHKNRSKWSTSPLSVMQRDTTSQSSITSKNITHQNRKPELNMMTEESDSLKDSGEKHCLPEDEKFNSTEPSVISTQQFSSQNPGKELHTDMQEIDKLVMNSISVKQKDVFPGEEKNTIDNNYTTSRCQENLLQGLRKQCQNTSLATDIDNMAIERNSSVTQSKTQHTQKDIAGIAKTTETKIRVGMGLLGESSKIVMNGTKSASAVIPLKPSKTLQVLQVSRPQVAIGKAKAFLKQTNERMSYSKLLTSLSPTSPLPKDIFPLTELDNRPSSQPPPTKRKPMELITETSTMKPLKRIARSLPEKEYMLLDDVRKSQNHLPSPKNMATDQIHRKSPGGHLSEDSEPSPGRVSEEKPKHSWRPPKSVQEEVLENVRQAEFEGSNDQPNQHINSQSIFQEQIKDSDDISIPDIDNYVRKADNMSHELEYMCNILQKKHEEANEILIRSIVANNLLLMLNHPLHEEKIQTIKKYAVSMLHNNAQDEWIK